MHRYFHDAKVWLKWFISYGGGEVGKEVDLQWGTSLIG